MRTYYKQGLWIFLIFTAVLFSAWHTFYPKPMHYNDKKDLTNMPDTFITHLKVTQFNEHGELTSVLTSSAVKHIPQKNTHYFTDPTIVAHQEKTIWTINSKQATALQGTKKIIFKDQVIVRHTGNNNPTQMETEELIYYPENKFAKSRVKVTFMQPGSIVQSIGMHAWLEDKHIVLLDKARATYEPNHA